MKPAHYVEMRVFSQEWDDEDRIVDAIKRLYPFDMDKEKVRIEVRSATGFENRKIRILHVSIKKSTHVKAFIENFFTRLSPEQKEMLQEQLDSRLDKNLNFFIRLDKGKLLEDQFWLTDSGNCFHFRFAIAAYPHKREVAEQIILGLLKR